MLLGTGITRGPKTANLIDTGMTGLHRQTCYLVQVSQGYIDSLLGTDITRGPRTARLLGTGITGLHRQTCYLVQVSQWDRGGQVT